MVVFHQISILKRFLWDSKPSLKLGEKRPPFPENDRLPIKYECKTGLGKYNVAPMTCTTALPLIMSKLVSEAKQEGSKSQIAGCKSPYAIPLYWLVHIMAQHI